MGPRQVKGTHWNLYTSGQPDEGDIACFLPDSSYAVSSNLTKTSYTLLWGTVCGLKENRFKQSCCIRACSAYQSLCVLPSEVNGVIRTAKEVHILKAFMLIDRGEQYHVSLEREERRAAAGIVVITSQSISSEGNFKHFPKLLTAVCSL